MSLLDRLRGAARPTARVDADSLVRRSAALADFLTAVDGVLPYGQYAPAREVAERTDERLSLSRDHTVVALAGATGSGKSSLFNALSRLEISAVGVRRPTTGEAHACVWGQADGRSLLDWLGVSPARRFVRESALDADDEAALRGLVLLDLPDFDSIAAGHRREVDRLLALVDLVVWVTDPQKYADQVIHEDYLTAFHAHRDITVVVLNQADRLSPADARRCVEDLSRLLADDGLGEVPVLPVSAVGAEPGLAALRGLLEGAVGAKQAVLRRLAVDLDTAIAGLSTVVGDPAPDTIDPATKAELRTALAGAAGVPAIAEAAQAAYRQRAARRLGWPVLRVWRRGRADPLRRLHLDQPGEASSLPEPAHAQQAAASLAVRRLSRQAGEGLPEPWPIAVAQASRARVADLPDALDQAVTRTDLGLRTPVWWRLVAVVQWLVTLAALVGLVWLGVRLLFSALALGDVVTPKVGRVPVPTALLIGGLLAGLLIAVLTRPLADAGARRARRRATARLRSSVDAVAEELVIEPVRAMLRRYSRARDALARAGLSR
jgi:energy-coupling factor transporter ATP-binding protein EcfA2